jgi:hypothetical protein
MSVEEQVASVGDVADAALALIRPQAATKASSSDRRRMATAARRRSSVIRSAYSRS